MIAQALLAAACAALAQPEDQVPPARLDPALALADRATPSHTVHLWRYGIEDGQRDYAWSIPPGFNPSQGRTLVVMLHDDGQGPETLAARFPHGEFRPADVVLWPSGPSDHAPDDDDDEPDAGGARFVARSADFLALRGLIQDARGKFTPGRVVLYGFGGGAEFAVKFAGAFPATVDAVIAHAPVAPIDPHAALADMPVVFLAGTDDRRRPFEAATRSAASARAAGATLTRLRRVPDQYDPFDLPRVSECVDWCVGMTTRDPREALRAAEAMLAPKGEHERTRFSAPVDYAGAFDALQRILGRGPRPMQGAPQEVLGDARILLEEVELEAEKHLLALRQFVRGPEDLKLDGRPWLGHLACVRDDFRGVKAVEDFVRALGFDGATARQAEAADALARAWDPEGEPRVVFRRVLELLEQCWMIEYGPRHMPRVMERWFGDADDLGIDAPLQRRYEILLDWRGMWSGGYGRYMRIWEEWRRDE